MKKQKPRFPVREYLGKFSKWLLVMRGRSSFRSHDKVLERLFKMFPGRTGVEQFTSVDIADYRQLRLKQGISDVTLKVELSQLKGFWRWLIEDLRLPVNNPVRAFQSQCSKSQFRTSKQFLSLTEVNRLLDECPTTSTKRSVLRAVQGYDQLGHVARNIIRDAALRAGLIGFSLSNLKIATKSRLNREIVQAYAQQLLDALPQETQLYGNAIATVQVPTLIEGTPISNSNNGTLVIGEINQE